MRVNAHLMEMTAVEGMMNYLSLLIMQMVWEMASKKKNNLVAIECGVSVGNSTVAILSGLARSGQGRLWSYDIQDNETAVSNVEKAGLNHLWMFTKSDSIKAAEWWDSRTIDFLFLDTDHEYENTKNELAAWAPKISHGGRILLHDTLTSPNGVGRAIEEFLNDERNKDWSFYNIDVCCGLGVLIKP